MRRREFISLLGALVATPFAARAQQSDRLRRIAVLGVLDKEDPETKARMAAFQQALASLGWTEGVNLRIDYRWAGGDFERVRKYAAELVALGPDVILAEGSPVGPLLQATSHNIPIVFTNVVDPVGSGFVASMSHPGGNATGFTQFEYRVSGKWLELLREVAPNVSRVAVIRDPRLGYGIGQFAVIQAMAPEAVELFPISAGNSAEIERAVSAFARSPNGGLIVTSGSTAFHRDIITSLATRHRLPSVYPFRYWAVAGGLISYGPNSIDPSRRAAGYIDRILKGEKPADLPVQAPTKYELVINLKTAKALSLTVPPALLGRADEVIE
ncbi:MAG TPA: ABC transporter substrate-binding protein [Pseudolabrys sp.]|jgi:putative ABC transport system substrate-binding protein|nr:ABC transporter substrate-binding protein [Pseudolabrys sp.]